jgi:hypothetical protein
MLRDASDYPLRVGGVVAGRLCVVAALADRLPAIGFRPVAVELVERLVLFAGVAAPSCGLYNVEGEIRLGRSVVAPASRGRHPPPGHTAPSRQCRLCTRRIASTLPARAQRSMSPCSWASDSMGAELKSWRRRARSTRVAKRRKVGSASARRPAAIQRCTVRRVTPASRPASSTEAPATRALAATTRGSSCLMSHRRALFFATRGHPVSVEGATRY